MCIRDRAAVVAFVILLVQGTRRIPVNFAKKIVGNKQYGGAVSYTHLRAHETVLDFVCRLLLEKKKNNDQ